MYFCFSIRNDTIFYDKIFTHFLLVLLLPFCLKAQENPRYWSAGKLSWKDFSIKQDTTNHFGLEYHIEVKTEDFKQGRVTIRREAAKVYVEPHQLWINPSQKSDQYLKYLQGLFDIGELHRKKLQQILDSNIPKSEADSKYLELQEDFQERVELFKIETDNGTQSEKLKEKILAINRESSAIKLKVKTIYQEERGVSYSGGYLFISFFGNDLKGYKPLYAGVVANPDFILGRNRINLSYGFAYNFNTSLDKNPYSTDFASLAYGFEIVKMPNFRFYPLVGGMVSKTRIGQFGDENGSLGLKYGVEMEFLLKKLIVTSCRECRSKQSNEWWIGLGYNISRMNFMADKSGNAHFITLSIKRIGRSLY